MTPDAAVLLSRETLTVGSLPKRRNPNAVYVLGVLTLGIYFIVWFHRVSRELHAFDDRIPGGLTRETAIFALGWPIGVPQFLLLHWTGLRIEAAQRSAGIPPTCDALTGIAMWLCFGVGAIYLQDELNKIVDRYGAPTGTEVFHFA